MTSHPIVSNHWIPLGKDAEALFRTGNPLYTSCSTVGMCFKETGQIKKNPMINTLSQIRKEAVNPNLSPSVCEALLQWHRAAQRENIPWRKLELLALGEERPQKPPVRFKAGTKLLRIYQGKSHLVIVTNDKKSPFLYEGQSFRSLSSIAQTITGTKWNGNLFFKCRRHG